ncbi:MAG: dihydrofolate reductase family protein [Microthrixaceae bacterium]
MRQLLPGRDFTVDPRAMLVGDPRPAPEGRPWVMANMVASVDGAFAAEGRSGGLSGPADRAVFHVLRGLADMILVAAGTARAERYRRPTADAATAEERRARGQAPVPRLAVVSRRALIPRDQPFLEGDGPDPLLLHPAEADVANLPPGVEPRVVGHGSVDLAGALAGLYHDGARTVLCEGGPRLLGQLAAADLIDELFVTVSPVLSGGEDVGLLRGAPPMDRPLELHRVLEDDGFLLLTYRRRR